ncbi:hypothetical protein KC678_00630, partial [Candidatus Dojkabacteria bacterium]|nr:hypothetical protein [Candidatus Dojkabacteria bacterium]
ATLYTYSYDYAETYSTEGSGTNTTEIMVDPVPTPFVNSFAIINLNNRIYKLNNYSGSDFDYSSISLNTINPAADPNAVRNLVEEVVNRNNSGGGIGIAEPSPIIDPISL